HFRTENTVAQQKTIVIRVGNGEIAAVSSDRSRCAEVMVCEANIGGGKVRLGENHVRTSTTDRAAPVAIQRGQAIGHLAGKIVIDQYAIVLRGGLNTVAVDDV